MERAAVATPSSMHLRPRYIIRQKICFALAAALIGLLPLQAHAGKLMFGTEERIDFVANTNLPGPGDTRLYLGHLVRMHSFGLPYRVESGGYVLGISGESKKYIPLPEEGLRNALQTKGLLPNPLPPIEREWLDYLFGYSLWWGLLTFVGFPVAKMLLRRR